MEVRDNKTGKVYVVNESMSKGNYVNLKTSYGSYNANKSTFNMNYTVVKK